MTMTNVSAAEVYALQRALPILRETRISEGDFLTLQQLAEKLGLTIGAAARARALAQLPDDDRKRGA